MCEQIAVKRTERGWVGHYILADRCAFRRNTLLELGDIRIVVSTVGMQQKFRSEAYEPMSRGKWFETLAFEAMQTGSYWDSDVRSPVEFASPSSFDYGDSISIEDRYSIDQVANDNHERVVVELIDRRLIYIKEN